MKRHKRRWRCGAVRLRGSFEVLNDHVVFKKKNGGWATIQTGLLEKFFLNKVNHKWPKSSKTCYERATCGLLKSYYERKF
jgi:hypothetical protein